MMPMVSTVARLPLNDREDAIAPPASQSPRPNMLVVDDEEGPRQSLHVIFKDDFNLFLADDGATAIEMAQQNKIDVAVLDIRMAGMTGIEVLERIKYVDPSIEAIMMTAFETNDTLRQALRLQACDYVNKPFDISTMRAAVAAAMERRTLASEVRKNKEELDKLQRELHQQSLEKQNLLNQWEIYAGVIHDINGPLTIISGLLQMINQGIGIEPEISGEALDQVKDRLKRITRQVTNCISISRRYLTMLRNEYGENPQVWVNQILGDLGELIRVHPCARNNQVIIHPLAGDVTAFINGTDLIQTLLNLSWNALQCTPNNHQVEIRGQLLQDPLDLSHFQDGPEDRFINRDGLKNTPPLLALSVQDNGPGISPEIMPQIFEPFFSSRSRAHTRGTGLGLCIVHRLIKNAHAALHVHSKVGQGSVFTIYLPARAGGKDTPAPA